MRDLCVSTMRLTPASVRQTITPRPSSSAAQRFTSPSSSRWATRLVKPERETNARSASSTWLGDTVSFRWAILHTIEEAARHAGHADLMRERIDNTTGYLPSKNVPY